MRWAIAAAVLVIIVAVLVRLRRRRGEQEFLRLLGEAGASTRPHHYQFAHYVLRSFCLENPLLFVAMFRSEEASARLQELWSRAGEDVVKHGMGQRVEPDGLSAHPVTIANRPGVIVQLPTPQGTTEAHFVAGILDYPVGGPPPDPKEKYDGLFFTLEKGFSAPGDPPRTVLGRWNETGHLNFGDGPAPELDAFRQRIEAMVGPLTRGNTA